MNAQRFLALAGVGSRRQCDRLIAEGRVTVGGQALKHGVDIQPGDEVRVDGAVIHSLEPLMYLALCKPAGCISDRGVPGEKSALDLVDLPQRLYAAGRLDKDASGLLLLTNDGELALRLTHPRFEHEKEYLVRVTGQPAGDVLQRWREGVRLQGESTAPAQVSLERREDGDTWLRVTMREGRKRQIKRVAKLLGHPVRQIIRVRIGPVALGRLQPGQWRPLSEQERASLGITPRGTDQTRRQPPSIIAIDGPAASGKSTLGAALAGRLDYLYFDTGVMYRAVTLAALRQGIDLRDETALAELAGRVRIEVTPPHVADGRQYTVWLDGADVTWDIRAPEVDAGVSLPSACPGVRAEMVEQQRRIGAKGRVVMVGRDIGTVVMPEAGFKLFLSASVEERARRRAEELRRRGEPADDQQVLDALRRRDELDASRSHSPLRPAEDAVIVDSTGRSPEEVMEIVCRIMDQEGRA